MSLAGTTAVRQRAVEPTVPLPYRVVRTTRDTEAVFTIDLEPVDAAIEPPAPGQFCMVYAFGVGEVPLSVGGCPDDEGLLRHTIHAVGAVTRALGALAPGDQVGIRGPYGVGWPTPAPDRDLLVVAGGIGLAPLRPVLIRAAAGTTGHRSVGVAFGARTPAGLIYRDELARWEAGGMAVELTVDHPDETWTGHSGLVTGAVERLPFDPARAQVLVCGPEVMMRGTARQLVDAGVDPQYVFVSLERNMHCAVGHCGHCQLGPTFVCLDGPVLAWPAAAPLLAVARW